MKHSYVLNNFTFYDRSGISEYLEKKAEEGWMLEKTGSVFWRFAKIEPKHINFAVTYFPSASEFDPAPSENQLRFRDFCEHTGWHHIADSAQMQIYCNESEDPVPIETDALIEVETIHKCVKKTYLPGYWVIFGIGIFMLLLGIFMLFDNPVDTLSSPSGPGMFLLGLCEAAMGASELILYYNWYRKAKKAAEESGTFVRTRDCRWLRWLICTVMLMILAVMFSSLLQSRDYSFHVGRLLLLLFVMLLPIPLAVYAAKGIMKKLGVSAKVNQRVTAIVLVLLWNASILGNTLSVFEEFSQGKHLRDGIETYEYNGSTFYIYHDELPLYLEDLTDTADIEYSTKAAVSSTPFVSRSEYFQRPRLDSSDRTSLEYTVVDVKLPVLFDMCLEDILGEGNTFKFDDYGNSFIYEYAEIDPAEWNADRAYQLKKVYTKVYSHDYILVYGNRIVNFKPDFHPDSQMKETIAEKLGEK